MVEPRIVDSVISEGKGGNENLNTGRKEEKRNKEGVRLSFRYTAERLHASQPGN
jgi:hypothetical protein